MFSDPGYFWAPVSSVCAREDRARSLAPLDEATAAVVERRLAVLRDADPENRQAVPCDLVAEGGDVLDPYLSPAAVEYQVERVARLRNLDPPKVRALVAEATEGRLLGLFGQARVDVVKLNLALDRLQEERM
jgi:K+-transporting ATPase ATPase C chain